MIDSLYYSSRKVPGSVKTLLELQNKLPKALWFNEANYERIELTQCILQTDDDIFQKIWQFRQKVDSRICGNQSTLSGVTQ